jgi:hypothetical protein
MYVNHVTETEDGTVKFEGELSTQELEAVVAVGLNVLLKTGSLIQMEKPEDATLN